MFAGRGVEARIGNPQARHGLVVHNMRLHDLIDIGQGDVAVPDSFGVNDYRGAMLTLIQAPSFVGPDSVADGGLGEAGLESALEIACCGGITTAARMVGSALISTDKDVLNECWHFARSGLEPVKAGPK